MIKITVIPIFIYTFTVKTNLHRSVASELFALFLRLQTERVQFELGDGAITVDRWRRRHKHRLLRLEFRTGLVHLGNGVSRIVVYAVVVVVRHGKRYNFAFYACEQTNKWKESLNDGFREERRKYYNVMPWDEQRQMQHKDCTVCCVCTVTVQWECIRWKWTLARAIFLERCYSDIFRLTLWQE